MTIVTVTKLSPVVTVTDLDKQIPSILIWGLIPQSTI